MGVNGVRARSEAIVGFATVLAELRASVGNPSFRAMAGRSKAISHTTLHEAVQGNRLPSWATTAEFVKACGAEPQAYRDRWESAYRALGQTQTADIPGAAVDDPPAPGKVAAPTDADRTPLADPDPGVGASDDGTAQLTEPSAGTSRLPGPDSPAAGPRRRRRMLVAALLLPATAAGAIGGAAWSQLRQHDSTPLSGSPTYQPADCPVRQVNPPSAAPEHEGDRVTFVQDLTIPDCTHLSRRQTVRKVWQLRNSGSVEWRGYSLHRIDPQSRTDCQTITDIPVPTTAPGHLVDVAVEVTTSNEPGFCFARFKMVDGAGKMAYPGGRPLNFQLIVDP